MYKREEVGEQEKKAEGKEMDRSALRRREEVFLWADLSLAAFWLFLIVSLSLSVCHDGQEKVEGGYLTALL